MAREWTECDIRNLIQQDGSGGQTMVIMNTAILSGELNTAVRIIARDAYTSFEAHAVRVTEMATEMATVKAQIDNTAAEMATAKSEIQRILADCNTFVQQTRDEANSW